MSCCDDLPSDELYQAVRQFNGGEYFDCHETLEDLWVGSEGEMRDFYQGVLQIAVAIFHWRKGNFAGAMHLLETGAKYLGGVRGVCRCLDVARLISDAGLMKSALSVLGQVGMADLAPAMIPKVHMVPGAKGGSDNRHLQ